LVEIYDFTYTLTESIPLHQENEITDADVNVDLSPIIHVLEALSDVVWLQK